MAVSVTESEHNMEIKYLIPAVGVWFAVFDDDTARQIACWALMECRQHGKAYVAPMVSFNGEMVDATVLDGYVEALPEEEEDEMPPMFDGGEPDTENPAH